MSIYIYTLDTCIVARTYFGCGPVFLSPTWIYPVLTIVVNIKNIEKIVRPTIEERILRHDESFSNNWRMHEDDGEVEENKTTCHRSISSLLSDALIGSDKNNEVRLLLHGFMHSKFVFAVFLAEIKKRGLTRLMQAFNYHRNMF